MTIKIIRHSPPPPPPPPATYDIAGLTAAQLGALFDILRHAESGMLHGTPGHEKLSSLLAELNAAMWRAS